LTSHPEEGSRGPHAGSIEDSAGSSDARLEILEEPSGARAPSKDGVAPGKVPTTHRQSESTDCTVPPPDASNLSTDGSNEKEQSSSGEIQKEEMTADESFHPDPHCEDEPSAKEKPPVRPSSSTNHKGEEEIPKPLLTALECIPQAKPKSPSGAMVNKYSAGVDVCAPPPTGEDSKSPRKSTHPSREKLQNASKSTLPKESNAKVEQKSRVPSGKPASVPENVGADRAVCLPQRRGTAESNDSVTRLAEQVDAVRAEEGTAARCEPITKLKLVSLSSGPSDGSIL